MLSNGSDEKGVSSERGDTPLPYGVMCVADKAIILRGQSRGPDTCAPRVRGASFVVIFDLLETERDRPLATFSVMSTEIKLCGGTVVELD